MMAEKDKNSTSFNRNVIIVFIGTSLANFFNLLYQLFIAHRLSPQDFAAFNTLLSIFVLFSAPFSTLQTAVVKYSSELNAKNQLVSVRNLLSALFKKTIILAALTFLIFSLLSLYILDNLKIHSFVLGQILSGLLAISWITPVILGGLQGMELFGYFISALLIPGILKLSLAIVFILSGFNIAGALGALLAATFFGLAIGGAGLKKFLSLRPRQDGINFREIFFYLLPVAISLFCFMGLVNLDMVLVRYFFSPQASGIYALAQMLGKIFLFLPAAAAIVLLPKASGLNAKNLDTLPTLQRSLCFTAALCFGAALFYNVVPGLVLRILTGKAIPESISLGRLFSLSMSCFSLVYIFITYFLSVKDLRFIKYLALSTILQSLAIVFVHKNLVQIQLILCINAVILVLVHLCLAFKNNFNRIRK